MGATRQNPSEEDEIATEMEDLVTAWRDGLVNVLEDFADKEAIPTSALAPLLIEVAVSLRMAAYLDSSGKPSALGLKRELDLCLADIQDLVRISKKGAEDYIAHARDAMAEADEDEEPG
jgi:hypothetical protein